MPTYCEGGGMLNINGNNIFTRNIIITPDEAETIRNRFHNKDCYISAYQYDSQDRDTAKLFGPYYIDLDYQLDNDDNLKILKYDLRQIYSFLRFQCDIPKESINIYFSGCKGFHILVDQRVFGIKEFRANLNQQYKSMTSYILENIISYKTTDLKIYDKSRLFRMVNSINCKTGLYKVPIDFDKLMSLSYDGLREYAKKPKLLFIKKSQAQPVQKAIDKFKSIWQESKAEYSKQRSIANRGNFEIPQCIMNMIEAGSQQGNRNNTCIIIASALAQSGKTEEEISEALTEWNSHNIPRLGNREIKAVITSALKEHNAGKGYGCRSIRELGYCVGVECKYYR